jgi:Protein of unknown function (DUF1588)/Protein of unknown function (DUF1592)/Protein of unknown function (DUF1595)
LLIQLFCFQFLLTGCSGRIPGRDEGTGGDGAGAGGVGGSDAWPDDTVCTPSSTRLVQLTPEQYRASVAQLFPGVDVKLATLDATFSRTGVFSHDANGLRMTTPAIESLLSSAKAIAHSAVASPSFRYPCLKLATVADACLSKTLDDLLPRAFRRVVTADDRERHVAFFKARATAEGAPAAAERLLQVILMAPEFNFRTEGRTVSPTQKLDAHELASAVAFLLTDAPPDPALVAAADDGSLASTGTLREHVMRLLNSKTLSVGVKRMFRELFRQDLVLQTPKDATLFRSFDEPLRNSMVAESEGLIDFALWESDNGIESLIASPRAWVDAKLATYYGMVDTPSANGREWLDLPPERAGLFTQGSLMATLASAKNSNAVQRGNFIRKMVLCGDVPAPPKDLMVVPVQDDGRSTMRERLAQHSSDTQCATCHSLMDPMGLSFEIFDAAGAYRTSQNGKPIDGSAAILDSQSSNGEFASAAEMMQSLARGSEAVACFAQHMEAFVQAGIVTDNCGERVLAGGKSAKSGDLLGMFADALTATVFTNRRNEELSP